MYEPKPRVGETMPSYCDCANRARDASQPVLTEPVQTTWICKASFKLHLSRTTKAFDYYWECTNCGKQRMIGVWGDGIGSDTYYGDGSQLKDNPHAKDCFVATAVYGSLFAPEVLLLRMFRDGSLMNHRFGRFLVRIYYCFGPWLAQIVSPHPLMKAVIRRALFGPIVFMLRYVVAPRP